MPPPRATEPPPARTKNVAAVFLRPYIPSRERPSALTNFFTLPHYSQRSIFVDKSQIPVLLSS